MMKKWLAAALIFLPLAGAEAIDPEHNPEHYLEKRLGPTDARRPSFIKALELLEERGARTLVETGTARDGATNFYGDGGSTVLFGNWAYDRKAILSTVDISEQAIERAKDATVAWASHIDYFVSDSVAFLENFGKKIDFLYLDSFDYDIANPTPSQEHHLREIKAAEKWLHEKSIVMIDDCDLPFGGKGKLVIEYLSNLGWKTLYSGYQVILTHP